MLRVLIVAAVVARVLRLCVCGRTLMCEREREMVPPSVCARWCVVVAGGKKDVVVVVASGRRESERAEGEKASSGGGT
jgi:hypothetical protein